MSSFAILLRIPRHILSGKLVIWGESGNRTHGSFQTYTLAVCCLTTRPLLRLSQQLDSNQRSSVLQTSSLDHSDMLTFCTSREIRTLTIRFWRSTGTTYADKYFAEDRGPDPQSFQIHLFSRQAALQYTVYLPFVGLGGFEPLPFWGPDLQSGCCIPTTFRAHYATFLITLPRLLSDLFFFLHRRLGALWNHRDSNSNGRIFSPLPWPTWL